jgi:hypothetical protein
LACGTPGTFSPGFRWSGAVTMIGSLALRLRGKLAIAQVGSVYGPGWASRN